MEREAALAAVRADGLELRKMGEFRADKASEESILKKMKDFVTRHILFHILLHIIYYIYDICLFKIPK